MRRILTSLALLLACNISFAQSSQDKAVELNAVVQVSPPKITLHWKQITTDTPTIQVWKKAKSAISWGTALATLTATDTVYADTAVIVDSAYEYQVFALGSVWGSSGYIYAGIKAPAIHNRGAVILMVDSTFSDSCAAEIKTLMNDLSGDGWQVIRHDFARSRPDTFISAVISNDYATHLNVTSVLLLGHVAVPYSGDLNPDGHPDHLGAWPADVYYACFAAAWTDAIVNDPGSSYVANRNILGDGKWDHTYLPLPAVLHVGRVDFYNMPAFSATEIQMMRRYLVKDHSYKMDSLAVIHRGLISDNFGYFSGEAFGANGYRNFAPLVGRNNVAALPFVSTLSTASYQWAYGCGGGSFTSASGIGVTSDFAANANNSIFTMLFGSYFGDWNVQNNFLRAPLCANPPSLTNCWAGRPNWFLHHMALGESIGYSAMLTQNNNAMLYQPANYGAGFVHVALMGDPSLRTDYIKPVTNLVVTTPVHSGAMLNWTASVDPGVIGYYVYRADSVYGYYTKISSSMVTGTSYHDLLAPPGLHSYMVRPVKLQSSPSGQYYNLGVGMYDTATITFSVLQVANVHPTINVSVFPNPAQNNLNVTVNTNNASVATMFVVNAMGQSFATVTKQLQAGDNAYNLNLSDFAPGNYSLIVKIGDTKVVQKFVKL